MRNPLTYLASAAATFALLAPSAAAHVVQPGESLWSIAQANGISVAQLASANGVGIESGLIAGTTVVVPGASTTTNYSQGQSSAGGRVVQPGESLWSIAQANGISVASLAAANGLGPNSMLIAGRSIAIPSGSVVRSAGSSATGPQTTAERLSAGQIGDIAQQYGMSRSLVQAVGWQESGFNNAAYSSADARGIMQIIPGTWQFINNQLAGGTLNPASAVDNVRAGSLYLRYLYRIKGGNRDATIGSYYQGPGRQYVLPETQRYVTNVLSFKDWFASRGK